MQYLKINHLDPGMVLARPILGENGTLLLNAGNPLSQNVLKRMSSMEFQGAYIDTPGFQDIEVQDVISDMLRVKAFNAIRTGNIMLAADLAKKMVREMRDQQILKMDLLDIKNEQNYVLQHCVSVAVFSVVVGIGCNLNEEQLDNLAVAGLLHDIGKFEVKKRVLNSKHVYNDKEMDEMKKHPMYSYEILKEYPSISSVTRNSILFHHENLDGTGYYAVSEEKLGLFPRILRVVDTYDALTAQKKYRDASAPSEAVEYIMGNVGKMFDRDVVDVFVRHFPVYPVGFTLRLSNGETVVIVSNEKNALRPLVRRMDKTEIDLATDRNYRSVMIEEIL